MMRWWWWRRRRGNTRLKFGGRKQDRDCMEPCNRTCNSGSMWTGSAVYTPCLHHHLASIYDTLYCRVLHLQKIHPKAPALLWWWKGRAPLHVKHHAESVISTTSCPAHAHRASCAASCAATRSCASCTAEYDSIRLQIWSCPLYFA